MKTTKDAIRHVMYMTYDNAEDYLVTAQKATNYFDHEGRKDGFKQFIDHKTYKPGLDGYNKSQSRIGIDAVPTKLFARKK